MGCFLLLSVLFFMYYLIDDARLINQWQFKDKLQGIS